MSLLQGAEASVADGRPVIADFECLISGPCPHPSSHPPVVRRCAGREWHDVTTRVTRSTASSQVLELTCCRCN